LHGPERIYYTTDAMAAAGAPPGRYSLGELNLEVGPDQMVRHPGRANFAGSALRPIDGVFRAARMLGAEWRAAWPAFSTQPAGFMNLPRGIVVGGPATFCVLRETAGSSSVDLEVYRNGESISTRRQETNPFAPRSQF
jgi:N-acetylglucosamine-6-phosphate deacetylase